MTTIHDLATSPRVAKVFVADYSFEDQERRSPEMGYPTWNSQQTFDMQGQPQDVRQDTDN